ncbi:MAG TPA: nickel-binding protein [Burkholderiaceae bacterium]|nr:nickel-binding protein [Burkholderiaceae bacterium]
MVCVIVERRFEPPISEAELQAVVERMTPCLEVYGVTWRRSFLSGDRRRMLCEYDAADAESVRSVQREANATFEVAWTAEVLEPT